MLGRSPELAEMPVRQQERLLDQVFFVEFSLQATVNLEPSKQRKIAPIPLQQLAQAAAVRSGQGQELLRVGIGRAAYAR
jgi:hypothetical protein